MGRLQSNGVHNLKTPLQLRPFPMQLDALLYQTICPLLLAIIHVLGIAELGLAEMAYAGSVLGPFWFILGSCCSRMYVGPCWGHVSAKLVYLGAMVLPCWPRFAHVGAILGLCWQKLGLRWPMLGPGWVTLGQFGLC